LHSPIWSASRDSASPSRSRRSASSPTASSRSPPMPRNPPVRLVKMIGGRRDVRLSRAESHSLMRFVGLVGGRPPRRRDFSLAAGGDRLRPGAGQGRGLVRAPGQPRGADDELGASRTASSSSRRGSRKRWMGTPTSTSPSPGGTGSRGSRRRSRCTASGPPRTAGALRRGSPPATRFRC